MVSSIRKHFVWIVASCHPGCIPIACRFKVCSSISEKSIWNNAGLVMCVYTLGLLLQVMWSNFLPLILLRPSAIIINIPISTHTHHICLYSSCYNTHRDMKEQPLLHTHRKWISCCPLCLILGCISAPVPHNLPLIPA